MILESPIVSGAPLTSTAPVNVTKAAAVLGALSEAAHSDHKHDVDTAAPTTDIGPNTTNTEGAATSLARSNHSHKVAINTFHVEQTSPVTTGSATDTRMGAVAGVGGIILTPGAGTFLAMFNTSVSHSANGNSVIVTLYVAGGAIADTVTTFFENNSTQIEALSLHDVITVAAGQDVEIKWRTSVATATARVGALTLIQLR